MKFKSYFQCWIKKCEEDGLRVTTISIYKGYLKNYISKSIGKSEVSNISIKELQTFYDNIVKSQQLSNKTLRNIHSVIHRCFRQAVIEGIIDMNPTDYIDLPKDRPKEVQTLTDAEIFKLENNIKDEPLGISIDIALRTGLRLGEILGLKWCDISFKDAELKVNRSLGREKIKTVYGEKSTLVLRKPKTKTSIRTVPLQKGLKNKLKELKNEKMKKYNLTDIEEDFVLSKKYKKPVDPRTIQEFFKRMQSKAGIGNYKFHALRHTFTSRAVKTGVSDKVISEILGHTNVTTTLNIYTHISDDMKKSLIDRL